MLYSESSDDFVSHHSPATTANLPSVPHLLSMPSSGSSLAGQEGVASDMGHWRSPEVSGQLKQSISMGLAEADPRPGRCGE